MKKVFLGAALLLIIGAAHASTSVSSGTASFAVTGRVHARQNILSSELPAALQAGIKKDYKDYWITALSEEQRGKHSDYYMTVENADQVMELRSTDATNWEVTSTNVKEQG